MSRTRGSLAVMLLSLALGACSRDAEEPPADSPEAAAQPAQAAPAQSAADAEIGEPFSTAILTGDPREETAAALQRFEAECAGASTPDCKLLQWRLEYALYEDLRLLQRAGPIDDELLRAGASADSPQLKAFALDRIRERGLRPEEAELVIAALNDPYPLARASAAQLAAYLPDPRWSRMQARSAGHRITGIEGLIAGVQPDAAALGAQLYPGATYWYFASDAEAGDFFTTPDAPDDVADFYAKGGKPVLSGEELRERIEAAKQEADPAEVMRLMQEALASGQDPATVMTKLTEGMAGASVDWTDGIEGREGVLEPRYVVLAEASALGKSIPERVVAVFRDEAMGATAMIFRKAPQAPAPAVDASTEEGVARMLRTQQILSSPDAQLR